MATAGRRSAAVLASSARRPRCAAPSGGNGVPSRPGSGIRAQSPTAHSRSESSTRKVGSVTSAPSRVCAPGASATSAPGRLPAVQTKVLVGICPPSESSIWASVAPVTRVPSRNSIPRLHRCARGAGNFGSGAVIGRRRTLLGPVSVAARRACASSRSTCRRRCGAGRGERSLSRRKWGYLTHVREHST